MSRTLEPDVSSALHLEGEQQAYYAISKALIPPSHDLLEIEILPKSHALPPGQFVLLDGPAVAVSKVGLVRAFFEGRRRLMSYRGNSVNSGNSSNQEAQDHTILDIRAATAIILLMDAEHLTAANTRKRLIKATPRHNRGLELALKQERRFVLSMLNSRLHRHIKSPTLWCHLQWVMEMSLSDGLDIYDVFQEQIGVVLAAAERHPRNYYAWCYARWLADRIEEVKLFVMAQTVQDWSIRHHNDTSGWSFLFFLLSKKELADSYLPRHCLATVIDLTVSFKWKNEATWVFLRTLAASSLAEDRDVQRLEYVLQGHLGQAEGSVTTNIGVLEQTQHWLRRQQAGWTSKSHMTPPVLYLYRSNSGTRNLATIL
jgi:protein prenyltransferase alpha subunit repeat containing protein 1